MRSGCRQHLSQAGHQCSQMITAYKRDPWGHSLCARLEGQVHKASHLGELNNLCGYKLELLRSALLGACCPLLPRREEQRHCEVAPPPSSIVAHAAIHAMPTGCFTCALTVWTRSTHVGAPHPCQILCKKAILSLLRSLPALDSGKVSGSYVWEAT